MFNHGLFCIVLKIFIVFFNFLTLYMVNSLVAGIDVHLSYLSHCSTDF